MPRSISGNYTLPLPPVVANAIILAAWANTTDDDIAQALTDSLDRYGRGGMVAPFRLINGTVAQPAWAFAAETNTGMALTAAGVLTTSIQGVDVGHWSATGLSLPSTLALSNPQAILLTGLDAYIGWKPAGVLTGYVQHTSAGTLALRGTSQVSLSTPTSQVALSAGVFAPAIAGGAELGSPTLPWNTIEGHSHNVRRVSDNTLVGFINDDTGMAIQAGAGELIRFVAGGLTRATIAPGGGVSVLNSLAVGTTLAVGNSGLAGNILSLVGANGAESWNVTFGGGSAVNPNVAYQDFNWTTGAGQYEFRVSGATRMTMDTTGVQVPSGFTYAGLEVGWRNLTIQRSIPPGGPPIPADAGCAVTAQGNVDFLPNVMPSNAIVTILNNTGAPHNLTQFSGMVLALAGTAISGTRTIANNGIATCWWVSPTTCYISGPGVT